MKLLLVGTDPEIFIRRKDVVLNAVPFVGTGTKGNPLPMERQGFYFMHDRAAIEWNQPPTNDLNTFKEHIKYAMKYIKDFLPEDVEFSKEASVFLSQEEIDKDDRCVDAGCGASFCCYTMDEEKKPDISKFPTLFTAAKHLHLQFDQLTINQAQQVGKVLDLFLGVPSTLIDNDIYRRDLYGKAGSCRFNFDENRMEYRVLSNFILFDDKLIDWMWNNLFRAIEFLNEKENIDHLDGQILASINEDNMMLAAQLSQEFNLLPSNIKVEV